MTSKEIPKSVAPTIMAFPGDGDSYTECHYQAMRNQGAHIVNGIFSVRWLIKNLQGVDFVHFHWPSFSYRHVSRVHSAVRFMRLCFLFMLAKSYGASIIWTAHNLYPHDRNSWPVLDVFARRILTRLATHVFAHGPSAARIVATEFPATRGKLTEIWHGHWIDYYKHGCSRQAAKAKFNIPNDAYVYAFIGVCKYYKNLHELIPTFQSMPGTAWLIITGRFQDTAYQRQIENLVAEKPDRIRFVAGYVPDDDLQYYFAASDIVVMPYLEILTSGSAMLALSFGRPLVAPRRGFLKDVIVPNVGLLYDTGDKNGFRTAMADAQAPRFDEAEILKHVRQYDWDSSARTVINVLKKHS